MLKFDISHEYKGTGISQGLDRGLLVYNDNILLLEEGMGLGACAIQTNGFTHFTSIKSIVKADDSFDVLSLIDTRLEWQILGIRSRYFTKMLEYFTTNIYMKNEERQREIHKLGGFLRKLFNVKACFIKVPIIGKIRVKYEVGKKEILVDLSCETEKTGSKLFVMNELGGSIFDKGIINGELVISPSGWQKIESHSELYSPSHSLAFNIVERHIPDNARSKLFWGREMIKDNYCWAGFESEIVWDSNKLENYRYSINFREVAKQ